MKKIRWLCCVGLSLALLSSLTAGMATAQEPMPETAYRENFPDRPFWISEGLLLDAAESPNSSLLDEGQTFTINEILENPPREGGCFKIGNEMPATHILGQDSVEKTLSRADWVFTATVAAREQGFWGARLGTLLRIEPKEVFLGPEDRLYPHYVSMPLGEVKVGEHVACLTDVRYPRLPEIGDEILLMVQLTARNHGEFLFGNDSMIITFEPNGRASLPQRFLKANRELDGLQREQLYEEIIRMLAEEDG